MWNPANPIHGPSLKNVETAATALKVQLHAIGVQAPEKLESAFSVLTTKHAEALVVFPDGMFLAQGERILDLAARHRLPTMYGWRSLSRRRRPACPTDPTCRPWSATAQLCRSHSEKAPSPRDLPIEQPTKFELVINLKTAKALRLDDTAVRLAPRG